MEGILQFFEALPPGLLYGILALGAALENIFPPLPADTFVLLGGFLSSAGVGNPRWVFVWTWLANVASALLVYRLGHVYGRPFFEHGWGRRLLNERQLDLLGQFYARWGVFAIFFTRFLPGFRAVVPAFAGVTHRRFWEVVLPLTLASALWYGVLVWLGAVTEQNLDAILGALSNANTALLVAALVLLGLVSWAWWRTRHEHRP
jgi:membrane protein DedA with SNARE-associated domain